MKNKQCSKCSKTKSLSEFYKDKSKKDGYRSCCKECNYVRTRPERPNCDDGYKYCPKCKKIKLLLEFSKDKTRKNGYQCWCKECLKEYRLKNKDYYKEYGKNWKQQNKQKSREYDKKFKQKLKEHCYCIDCGKQVSGPYIKRCRSCCNKYLYKIGILNPKGNKNGMYIDGRTPLNYSIRNSLKNKQWIKNIFQRDNYTCQRCGKRGCKLEVHHIKEFSKILKEFLENYSNLVAKKDKYKLLEYAKDYEDFWQIDNGITLCKDCHKQNHRNLKEEDFLNKTRGGVEIWH